MSGDFERAMEKVAGMQQAQQDKKTRLKEARNAAVAKLKEADPVMVAEMANDFKHPMFEGANLTDIQIDGEVIYHREVNDNWVDPLKRPIGGK